MPARSVTIVIVNDSDDRLVLSDSSLDHGIWTTSPPNAIETGETSTFESESDGFQTGTEGTVDFTIQTSQGSNGTAHFHWDNPFFGSNSYDQTVPVWYKAGRSGGDGNNTTVTWNFDSSSSTHDGIPDVWKQNGVTLDPGDGSGLKFIDLPAMGAKVDTPDIFVQMDWMADSTHSHAPSEAAIKMVVDAFANSPFQSNFQKKTGSKGINLHVDAGPNSIMDFTTLKPWGSLSQARQLTEVTNLGTNTGSASNPVYNWNAFDAIKNSAGGFRSTARGKIFHYAISAHNISALTNSGIARSIPGSDFIVSLASITGFSLDDQMGHTFMHELGHCLGLRHGGGDNINWKPNYISIMNYNFQFPGLTRGGLANICDYSNISLLPLDENNLDERDGLGVNAAGVGTAHWVPASTLSPAQRVAVADASKPIDWNGNGAPDAGVYAQDVCNDPNNPTLTVLQPFNDWENIKFVGGSIAASGFVPPVETPVDSISPVELASVPKMDTTPPVTTASVSPPANAAGWNREDTRVNLTAVDDISGVARINYNLDGAGFEAATAAPISITTEGEHILEYYSVDRSQNVEATKRITVRVDKTPPEAVIHYNPYDHEIVVVCRDALSGANPIGPVSPLSIAPLIWTDYGSDCAETRIYRLLDVAGNATFLTLRVKCGSHEYEFSISDINYNDEAKIGCHLPRNTITFSRLRGRGKGFPLLAVKQDISLGEGEDRKKWQATYDVLHDETEIHHGKCACRTTTHPKGEHKEGETKGCGSQDSRKGGFQYGTIDDQNEAFREGNCRGLVCLRIITDKGKLRVEE